MATSKTLTPTNVTIQIPEFTDQPDQRVNSNCIDKTADAVNALDSNKATIKTTTISMTEAGTILRLDNKGISVDKFIRAVVRNANYITCLPYSYNNLYYVAFFHVNSYYLVSGQYDVQVMYWE